ncbi:ABC transporter permease [Nonomuraea gerenzanensis]|uniref:Alkanesulfonates transport system permease protein n=1 Tax=Nonomuraea gerenzanensis TaxID=93944 RepID=A0A1M4E2I4_9ACTN|nr:ABC transporter permease [Nonomuraea gerenzanensis]UBU15293.1 ABC transporter permease [Nonomuraea gerenzanensis]SBO93038.1 Alkanesulfonates transport system permease protein [Nonomuraea gerenzanensis]
MSTQTLPRVRPASSASRWYRRAAGALAFAALIELASRTGLADPEFLPPASEIVGRAATLLLDPAFGVHALTSLLAWAIGLCVAALIAVPLGLLLGSVPIIDAAMRSVVEFLRPIPSVALIPLVALVIGTGLQHRVALVVYASLWPILYNTMYGLRGVDPLAKESLRSYGFGPLSVLLRVSLPSSAPFITTGFRLAAGVALILTVSTEIVAGRGEGIGVFIFFAGIAVPARMTDILAGVFWVGLFGVAVNALLVAVERRAFRWHHARLGERS